MTEQTSKTINAAKVMLMLGIVVIHCEPWGDEGTFFQNTSILICKSLTIGCVPLYFALSGYLFFHDGRFDRSIYLRKMKSRLHSLVIPYFLWNLLALLWFLTFTHLFPNTPAPWARVDTSFPEILIGFFYKLNGHSHCLYPYDCVMWFIRELIVISLLAPLTYRLAKRLSWWFPLIIAIICPFIAKEMYYSYVDAYIWYSIGVVMALHPAGIAERYSHRSRAIAVAVASALYIALSIISAYELFTPFSYSLFYYTSTLCCMIVFMVIAKEIAKHAPANTLKALVPAAMFIYCFHGLYIQRLLGEITSLLGHPVNWVILINVCGTCTIAILFGAAVYMLLKAVAPRVLRLLTGGR